MLKYIRHIFSPADSPAPLSTALHQAVQTQCNESIEAFRKLTPIKWPPRRILPSEGFLLCALCDLYGVDTFIESGVYDGRSTTIWAAWRDSSLKVVAIVGAVVPFAVVCHSS